MAMHELGLCEAVLAIRAGRLDPEAYAAALHARARQLDPVLRAFTVLAEPGAPADGPLGGIPVAARGALTAQEQPVVLPQVSHFRQVPLRTSVKFAHSGQASPT